MTWVVVRGNARRLALADDSVDLILCSPPYWGLRSYRDGGEHYSGQVGSESTPQDYVDELVGMIDADWRRVLKPSGSLWLNLGDKYAGSGGRNNAGLAHQNGPMVGTEQATTRRDGPNRYPQTDLARPKSLLGLPWRVALALIDRGWILRAEVIWSKPNGLPESVTDRVRRSHEQWFHLTLGPRYYAAVDRIREPLLHPDGAKGQVFGGKKSVGEGIARYGENTYDTTPLGRLPGSVRVVPTQPLIIPDQAKQQRGLTDHFAAFPMEWPRWIIEGWSPEKVCQVCGEGLRPVVQHDFDGAYNDTEGARQRERAAMSGGTERVTLGRTDSIRRTILGEACACDTPGPTTPGVVADFFGGTGTTAGVAHMLGRHGISVDLSADYCRLAQWRIADSGDFERFTYGQRPEPQLEGQGRLL